ncbi:MAG TPA: DUF1572 family protein [Saprospiraceae bacterium]|nr:DUF1572 family protein [Saprospiraceae bacterium]
MTTVVSLKSIFRRDLEKLQSEIEYYNDEKRIWHVEGNIANTAGNLCMHLIGNLNAYIGAELGKTGYIRNRPLEFSIRNVPRHELVKKINDTIKVVEMSLDKVTEDQLDEEYPLLVFEEKMTTGYFLIHLAAHLSYHLGQINYHRRLLDVPS